MIKLINWIKEKIEDYKRKKRFKKRIEELKKGKKITAGRLVVTALLFARKGGK